MQFLSKLLFFLTIFNLFFLLIFPSFLHCNLFLLKFLFFLHKVFLNTFFILLFLFLFLLLLLLSSILLLFSFLFQFCLSLLELFQFLLHLSFLSLFLCNSSLFSLLPFFLLLLFQGLPIQLSFCLYRFCSAFPLFFNLFLLKFHFLKRCPFTF